MQKSFYLLLLLAAAQTAQAQTPNSTAAPVSTKIEQVTVFLNGAQVLRKGNASVSKGRNELVFKGLSPYLDKESIRLKADGNITVLSVNYTVNHLEEQNKRTEVEALTLQQEGLRQKIDLENIGVASFQNENNALQRNDLTSSNQNGVKTTELKELMAYRTAKMRENNLGIYESNLKIIAWQKELTKANKQINEINGKAATSTGDVAIAINSDIAQAANFELSYSVANASWLMSYDLRVKDVASPMNLLYKANVKQQTGEDWKDVKLTFCTGNPNTENEPPPIDTWYLRDKVMGINAFGSTAVITTSGIQTAGNAAAAATPNYKSPMEGVGMMNKAQRWVQKQGDANCVSQNPADCKVWVLEEYYVGADGKESNLQTNASMSPSSFAMGSMTLANGNSSMVLGAPAGSTYIWGTKKTKKGRKGKEQAQMGEQEEQNGFVSSSDNMTTTLYEVSLPYTVLNDGKEYTAEIRNASINATYQYYATPKFSTDAFLTALVTDWDDLKLVGGEAALYYEGSYMGKTMLNPDNTNDTLRISLGVDKGIVVQRTKLKEFAKKQFWGDKQSEERAFEIAIRNRKSQAIVIIINDQFPVSPEKDISVEHINFKDAQLDTPTGKITWKQTIEPSKERKFLFHYKVKYPKGRVLNIE